MPIVNARRSDGKDHHAWKDARGRGHRIDFIMLSEQIHHAVTTCVTLSDLETVNKQAQADQPREGHTPVLAQVACQISTRANGKPPPKIGRTKLTDEEAVNKSSRCSMRQ
eukprot:2077383-Pyramimonas_sp.AAC.1